MRAHSHSASSSLRRRIVSGRLVGVDASSRRDPAGTSSIVRRFAHDVERRASSLKRLTREFLVGRDALGLRETTVASLAAGASQAAKIDAFARWFQSATQATLMQGGGAWIAPLIRAAYSIGVGHASARVGRRPEPPDEDQVAALVARYQHELSGIADATEQQAIRCVADGLEARSSAGQVAAGVTSRIDAVAVARARALAAFSSVDAHATASLRVYELAGVTQVGLVPETVPGLRPVADAKKPTRSQIARALRAQKKLHESVGEEVDVLTAGDDLVCQECEDIALDGPYDIDEAQGLIPAHPHCRCAFVPAATYEKEDLT